MENIYFYVISKIVENVSKLRLLWHTLATPSTTAKYQHIAIDYGRMKQTLICIAILLFSTQTNASLMGMNVFTFIQIYCVCNSAPMYNCDIAHHGSRKSKRCRWSRFSIRIQFITDLTPHTTHTEKNIGFNYNTYLSSKKWKSKIAQTNGKWTEGTTEKRFTYVNTLSTETKMNEQNKSHCYLHCISWLRGCETI